MYQAFAELYDELMNDVDYESWADYYTRLLSIYGIRGGKICECACGTGSLTVPLYRRGFQMTGVDLSQEMLWQAAQKSRKAGMAIPFVRQDMRGLHLHRPMDAVIATCDGVNYLLNGVEAFFQAAHHALKPGGLLLFDVSSAYKLSTILGNNTFAATGADWAYIWENQYHPRLDQVDMLLTGFLKQGTGYARFEERHRQRAYSEEELRTALESCGFGDIQVYEAFTRNTPAETAERLQFTARKE